MPDHNTLSLVSIVQLNNADLLKKFFTSRNPNNHALSNALDFAVKHGLPQIVEILVQNKANIFKVDNQDKSLLMLAAELGHTEVVTFLMRELNSELVIKRGLEKEIELFFGRLENRVKEVEQSDSIPSPLEKFITQADLIKTYNKILTDAKFKKQIENALKKGKPIRIAKEQSGLPYTINIAFDSVTHEIALLLETKSKMLSPDNTQIINNPKARSFPGSYKQIKPAYRIDKAKPVKWANAVYYAKTSKYLYAMQYEEAVSKNTAIGEVNTFINRILAGPIINKKGFNAEVDIKFRKKQSFYSKWANCGDLQDFLKKENINLTITQRKLLARQLLTAVYTLHKEDKIHQDIKTPNILVFKDEKGNIHLELGDFGWTYNPRYAKHNYYPTASLGFESPEISVLHKEESSSSHAYFYDKSFPSLGRDFADKLTYDATFKAPHKANDMWAVGVVLFGLFCNSWPNSEKFSQLPNTPISDLIKGLLNPDRTKRLTAEMALAHPSMQQTSVSTSPIILDALSKEKDKALMLAIENNHGDTVEELIYAGAKIAPQILDVSLGENKHPKIQHAIASQLFLANWGSVDLMRDKYFRNHALSQSKRSCIFRRQHTLSDWQKAQLKRLAESISKLPTLPCQKDILSVFEVIEKVEIALGKKYTYSDPKLNKLLDALQKDLKSTYKVDAQKIAYIKRKSYGV